MLRPVTDQQPGGDGLRQRAEGQPRRGSGDREAEGRTAGEAGVDHGGSAGAGQQLLLTVMVAPTIPVPYWLSCFISAR